MCAVTEKSPILNRAQLPYRHATTVKRWLAKLPKQLSWAYVRKADPCKKQRGQPYPMQSIQGILRVSKGYKPLRLNTAARSTGQMRRTSSCTSGLNVSGMRSSAVARASLLSSVHISQAPSCSARRAQDRTLSLAWSHRIAPDKRLCNSIDGQTIPETPPTRLERLVPRTQMHRHPALQQDILAVRPAMSIAYGRRASFRKRMGHAPG